MRLSILYYVFFGLLAMEAQKKESPITTIESSLDTIKEVKAKINLLLKEGEQLLTNDRVIAEKIFKKAESIIDEDDESSKAYYYKKLAAIYFRKEIYNKSLSLYHKARGGYEQLEDTLNITATLLKEGMIYKYLKEENRAIKVLKRGVGLAAQRKDSSAVGRFYIGIGGAYASLKKIDSSFYFYTKALEIFKKLKSERRISNVNNNLAILYGHQEDYEKAVGIHLNNLSYIKKKHNKKNLATTYYNIAFSFLKMKDYKSSMIYLDSSATICLANNYKLRLSKISEKRSQIYAIRKDFENAYKHNVLFKKYSDSVFDLRKKVHIKDLELKYEFVAKERELELLADKKESEKRLYITLFVFIILSGLVIGYLTWKNYKSRTQKVKDKYEKEKLKKQILAEQIKLTESEVKYLVADNTMRLKFIKHLSEQIKRDKDSNEFQNVQEYANSLLVKLQQQIITENKLSSVQDKINEVNKGFEAKIQKMFPDLTKTEREICNFLRLNLSIKEIASIRHSSIDSIKALRYRIRKKLEVPKNQELERYIQAI